MQTIIFVVVCTCLWNVCHAQGDADALEDVTKGGWEFTRSFYLEITKSASASESMLYSPLSVRTVLAMCYMGTGGETAKQISKGLNLPDNPDVVKSGFKQLLTSLPSASGNVTLEIANTIFPDGKFSVLKTFVDTVEEFFLSSVENVDYRDPKKAAKTINRWVKKKTHEKITDIVPPSGLDSSTKMVLVNAVYFKGGWERAFNKNLTSKAPFFVTGKDKRLVDTMHLTNNFRYQENDDIGAKLLELPYKDASTVLVIVLSLAVDGLSSVEAKLQKVDFMKFLEKSHFKEVQLSLPRFSLEQSTRLDSVIQGLGIVKMFQRDADFSKMTSESGVHVSEVLHRATLDVNEEGTVAAAVTEVDYGEDAAPKPLDRVEYVADHPFLFALISKKARVVLFMGRYTGTEKTKSYVMKSAADTHHKQVSRGKSSAASTLGADSFLSWMLFTVFMSKLSSICGPAVLNY